MTGAELKVIETDCGHRAGNAAAADLAFVDGTLPAWLATPA
jgi:hypothetical protein